MIAKVTRDTIMRDFCARFPEYCFSQHKGYGTELHLIKLHEHGPCPIHRRSFEPVAQPLFAFALPGICGLERAGEKLACQFLRRSGYKILYRNFRGRTGGEIDVVCRDGDTLVFVEVKTRTREDFGRPFEAVDRDKRKRHRARRPGLAAACWTIPTFFFVSTWSKSSSRKDAEPRLELLRNAFALPEPYIY